MSETTQPTAKPRPAGWRHWRLFWRYFRPSRRFLAFGLFLSAAQSLAFLPLVFLVRRAFDVAIPARRADLFLLYGLAVIGVVLAGSALSLWNRRVTLGIVKRAIRDLRYDLVEKCYALSRARYGRADLTRLRFTLVQDTERLDNLSASLLTQALPSLVVSLTLAALLVWLNWYLTLALAAVSGLLFRFGWRMKRRIVTANTASREAQTRLNRGVLFVLQMMDLTRCQSAEPVETRRQRDATEALREAGLRLDWLRAAYVEIQSVILSAAGVLILVLGGDAVVRGRMSVGELVSFYFVVALMSAHLRSCWGAIPWVLAGAESLEAVHAVLSDPDTEPYPGGRSLDFTGEVVLEDVTFAYDETPVLSGVGLALRPGTLTVLTGPNGEGKSTVANLVLGLYRPGSGRVTADGVPYEELDVRALRRRMGVVPQHPVLFAGTVRENLAYGLEGVTDERLLDACRLAGADAFLPDLPGGLDARVGEGGMLLSGGQRQRLALARAFLRRPRLLILDEPANHLDDEGVRTLAATVKAMAERPAVLWITHQPAVPEGVDRVLRLAGGRLAEVRPDGAGGEGEA